MREKQIVDGLRILMEEIRNPSPFYDTWRTNLDWMTRCDKRLREAVQLGLVDSRASAVLAAHAAQDRRDGTESAKDTTWLLLHHWAPYVVPGIPAYPDDIPETVFQDWDKADDQEYRRRAREYHRGLYLSFLQHVLNLIHDAAKNDATPEWPPATGWGFAPGKAAYNGTEFQVSGMQAVFLRRFVEARRPLGYTDLRSICRDDLTGESTIRKQVSDLRGVLRKALNLGKHDPLPRVAKGAGQTAWKLAVENLPIVARNSR